MKKMYYIFKIGLFIFVSIIILIIALYTNAYFSKPIELNTIGTYYLYDNRDNLIYEGSSKNEWAHLDEISPYLIDAIISVEDKNYYKHNGFDYLRIMKALFANIKNKKIVQGGSTISQQYIKNAYLDFDKTWNRKIKEALMTLNLEVHYSKEDILEAYLNTINFGKGNYGIKSAASYYFNKNPIDLTLEEAIILAGIPKSPNNFNPVKDYDTSIKRAGVVSLTMYNNGLIDEETYKGLFKNKIEIYGKKKENDMQMLMYYQDAIISELKTINGITDDIINSGNLKVYTTLDLDMEKQMEKEIITNISEYDDIEVASVIINPHNGDVLALTGGMDYSKSEFNRALYSKRQVGSTMKPFLYYAALENGMTSSSTFLSQYTTFNLDNQEYSPKNYGNIYANKDITMAAALAYSDNIYAVKTNLFLGLNELVNTAYKCGIKEDLNPVASLALGTSEINILDFANGYTTLASGGYKKKIHLIRKVLDQYDNVIYEYKDRSDLVLNPNYVFILNELLTSTSNPAFLDYNTPTALSLSNKLINKYAIKTGTTDTDYWIVGYNNDILMILWAGYDDNKDIPLKIGTDAKNIWANTVNYILNENNTDSWYKMPHNVVGLPLDAITGTPTNNSSKSNIFYYLKGSEPYFIE